MNDRDESHSNPKQPSHHAFQVKEGKEGQSYFNRVGAAFEHKDGQGFNIQLDSVPVDGRITLRTPRERLEESKAQDHKHDKGQER